MDLLQTLLVYMSLVFASSVQTAPEPMQIPEAPDYVSTVVEVTPAPTTVPTPVPTVDITPNPAYKTLQMGDRGEEVRTMQEKLQDYGYYDGEIDGAFGNQTRRSVEQFQYMHGLSVDGIAGRRTLTVLYESTEIRLPPGETATPDPTKAAQLTIAHTLPPQIESSAFMPTVTEKPAVGAAKPTAKPLLPVEELKDCVITVDNVETELRAFKRGDVVYLPMLEILEVLGVNVISSSTVELDEYAFAFGDSFVRITHTEDQEGNPVDLQVYRNDKPQLVSDRTLYRDDGILYVPGESVEDITGWICSADENEKTVEIIQSE